MPTKQDFSLVNLQASLFTPINPNVPSGKIVAAMLKHFAETFDGEMQVLPIPAELASEIPRVSLRSADGKRQFGASLSRINFLITAPADIKQAAEEGGELVARYSKEMDTPGIRLAMIVNRSCRQPDPAQTLISRFCNDEAKNGPFARSSTFEIHNHKEYPPPGLDYNVNSWVRCTCEKKVDDQSLLVLQDINTLQNDERTFQYDDIKKFFSSAAIAADEILGRYFPG